MKRELGQRFGRGTTVRRGRLKGDITKSNGMRRKQHGVRKGGKSMGIRVSVIVCLPAFAFVPPAAFMFLLVVRLFATAFVLPAVFIFIIVVRLPPFAVFLFSFTVIAAYVRGVGHVPPELLHQVGYFGELALAEVLEGFVKAVVLGLVLGDGGAGRRQRRTATNHRQVVGAKRYLSFVLEFA
jgi:hypothetical protein